MPSRFKSVSVSQFQGLQTSSPNDEGDMSQLIVAENVQFNSAGVLEARYGFRYISSIPEVASIGYLAGESREDLTGDFPDIIVLLNGDYYVLKPGGGVLGPITKDMTGSPPLPTQTRYGAAYNGFTFFTDGWYYDGPNSIVKYNADYPGNYGPVAVHNERLWCEANSRLFFSEVGDALSWPLENFIDIAAGEDDSILDIISYRDNLFVFKERSAWVLSTPGKPTSWSLRRLSDEGGMIQVAREHDGYLFYFGIKGAFRYNGVQVEKISEPVQDIWDNIRPFSTTENPNQRSHSTVYDDMYIICLGYENDSQRILCYNIKLNRWTEWTFPWMASDFEPQPYRLEGFYSEPMNTGFGPRGVYALWNTGESFLWTGMMPDYPEGAENEYPKSESPYYDSIGYYRLYNDETEEYYNSEENILFYEPTIQTKWFDLDDSVSKKRINQWLLDYEGTGMVVKQLDEERRSLVTDIKDEIYSLDHKAVSFLRQRRIRGIGYFRKLSLRVTFKTPGKSGWSLRSITARVVGRGPQIRNATEATDVRG